MFAPGKRKEREFKPAGFQKVVRNPRRSKFFDKSEIEIKKCQECRQSKASTPSRVILIHFTSYSFSF